MPSPPGDSDPAMTMVFQETIATQDAFDTLDLPEGAYRRRLTPDDTEMYLAFDELATFERNDDTPDDHLPARFEPEEIEKSMAGGAVFEGIFDANHELIAAMWLDPNAVPKALELANLIVHPDYRDRGIGHYFMKAAATIGEIQGFDQLALHVDPLNTRGMHVYTKNGFVAEGYESDNTHGQEGRLIMYRQLGAGAVQSFLDVHEVRAGDDKGLEAAIAAGLAGTGVRRSLDSDDPREQLVMFSLPMRSRG